MVVFKPQVTQRLQTLLHSEHSKLRSLTERYQPLAQMVQVAEPLTEERPTGQRSHVAAPSSD